MSVPSQLSIKIIHLPHRQDRERTCQEEIAAVGLHATDVHFFPAKYVEGFGALGCALSHAMALSEFLFHEEKPYALILEDDFSIVNKEGFQSGLRQILQYAPLWDVYLLAHNVGIPVAITPLAGTVKMVNAQTMSGYLVGRNYAPNLIASFFRSAELLRQTVHLPAPNQKLARHLYCCDMLWQELQIKDRFWAAIPAMSVQRPSYSDIEEKTVDYKV